MEVQFPGLEWVTYICTVQYEEPLALLCDSLNDKSWLGRLATLALLAGLVGWEGWATLALLACLLEGWLGLVT